MNSKISILFILSLLAVNSFAEVPSGMQGTWYLTNVYCGGVASTGTVPAISMTLGSSSGSRSQLHGMCMMTVPLTDITVDEDEEIFYVTEGTVSCTAFMPFGCYGQSACGQSGITKAYPYVISPMFTAASVQVAPISPYANPCGTGQSTSDVVFSYHK